ncbi:hypothetical protein NM688_g3992 [Phlebia brevispora]|uniref:Uncharacterized protein n=1 Tax=Phlebia brevispora TaxID=194682 RepID=A0ACC1T3X1_9APHY|nr:hypothetical protein NM688_g3992 [Phlebia brevispora]
MIQVPGMAQTAGMLTVFVLMMLWHPDVMRRAQAELDTVVGRERLPTLVDEDNLPYTAAIVRELLRLWPIAPLGLPRSTCEGPAELTRTCFTQGATIMMNLWAMGRNPLEFPDPDAFRPERFLDDESGTNFSQKTKMQKPFAFGFGRRVCPGRSVAMRTLFIDIACMLWALDIHSLEDEHGKPVLPSRTACVDDGLVTRLTPLDRTPVPFKCSIRPRSPDVRDVVEAAKQGMNV